MADESSKEAARTSEGARRFTDREVSVVLRRAVEIDEAEGRTTGRGLSLHDLEEIAREVGVAPASVARAVRELDTRRSRMADWGGASLVRKAVRGVPGDLDREQIATLIGVVDERADAAGAVSEAVGSVRWTSSDRMKSSFVSITPEGGETSIQVVEKARPRIRWMFHGLPAAWALMLAAPVVGATGLGAVGAAAVAAASVAVGAGLGRITWNTLSGLSGRRVEQLADALAERAVAISRSETPPDDG